MDKQSAENNAQIWNQLPDQNKRMLHERLFFLVLQKVGGIRHEPDTSVGDALGTAGGSVRSPILTLPGGTQSGKSELTVR